MAKRVMPKEKGLVCFFTSLSAVDWSSPKSAGGISWPLELEVRDIVGAFAKSFAVENSKCKVVQI
jgi:hypothetical protein